MDSSINRICVVDKLREVTTFVFGCDNYVVKVLPALQIPRWDLDRFQMTSKQIGSSMKSVGEVRIHHSISSLIIVK